MDKYLENAKLELFNKGLLHTLKRMHSVQSLIKDQLQIDYIILTYNTLLYEGQRFYQVAGGQENF